jgi:hypothetical protein
MFLAFNICKLDEVYFKKEYLFKIKHIWINPKMISYYFQDLSAKYKEFEEQGIKNQLEKDFEVNAKDCLPCAINFLNDAKIEYTNKPYIK